LIKWFVVIESQEQNCVPANAGKNIQSRDLRNDVNLLVEKFPSFLKLSLLLLLILKYSNITRPSSFYWCVDDTLTQTTTRIHGPVVVKGKVSFVPQHLVEVT